MSDVGRQQAQHILAQNAVLVQTERWNPNPLLPDFSGGRIVATVSSAANIALVRTVDRPEYVPSPNEHGHEHGHIGQMIVSFVRIVQKVNVIRPHAIAEELSNRLHRPWQSAHVYRHMLRLSNESPSAITDRGRKVPARIEDLRIRCTEHRLTHFVHNRV